MPLEEQTYREFVTEKLTSIEKQTIKTNGRVTTLESNYNKLDRKLLVAGTAIIVIILLKLPELKPLLTLL